MEHYVPTVGGEFSRKQQLLPLIVNHVINASMCAHCLTVVNDSYTAL